MQTIEEELVSVVCRSVNGLQQEMSIVGVLVLDETLADMLEIPVGTKGGELLEVTTKNHDRAMRKLPNRLPKSSELSVVVLRELTKRKRHKQRQNKQTKTRTDKHVTDNRRDLLKHRSIQKHHEQKNKKKKPISATNQTQRNERIELMIRPVHQQRQRSTSKPQANKHSTTKRPNKTTKHMTQKKKSQRNEQV